jgi:hypothetical protein
MLLMLLSDIAILRQYKIAVSAFVLFLIGVCEEIVFLSWKIG